MPACAGLVVLASFLAFAERAAGQEAKPPPAVVPVADDALAEALEAGELTQAEYALERARSVFELGKVRREFGDVARPEARDTTLILRDLAVRLRQLPPEERAAGRGLLARPTDGNPAPGHSYPPNADVVVSCDERMCIHWASNQASTDAPRPFPTWVGTVRSTLETVWDEELVDLGYRRPLDDSSSAQDDVPTSERPKLDIYLEDLGDHGLFGYCATDDPAADDPSVFAVSAYCVLDNDYRPGQYGTAHTAEEFLQVTAAHEFHHAVQFAYDFLEDGWLMEGTATNMEETVYPDVNDNILFLEQASQLTYPAVPLDRWGRNDYEYGSWIFWRYLQEKVAKSPGIVREVWENADAATATSPDDYSLLAVRNELAERGRSFPDEYAGFVVANRLRAYRDGSRYPSTPTHGRFSLGRNHPTTGWQSSGLDHLSGQFFSFTPASGAATTAKLVLDLDLISNTPRARVISRYKSGKVEVRTVSLGPGATGHLRVPFGRGVVQRVDLVLANASSRFTCWTADIESPPFYSCLGTPRDDDRLYRFRATHTT